jgi:hypothetical protein
MLFVCHLVLVTNKNCLVIIDIGMHRQAEVDGWMNAGECG